MGTIFRDDPLILNLNGILFKKKREKKVLNFVEKLNVCTRYVLDMFSKNRSLMNDY